MSGTDRRYEAYVYALREQVSQHCAGLDELSETLAARPLSFNERNAAERGLQVMVEIAVGCSKHWLKQHQLPVPAEARAALERVYERLALNQPPLSVMRGAVGMRNAIIHDYLNLDWQRLEAVLAVRKYHDVARYIEVLCAALLDAG
jgi:uncharacterized protein YutE (UPF0331/DUF86 family)